MLAPEIRRQKIATAYPSILRETRYVVPFARLDAPFSGIAQVSPTEESNSRRRDDREGREKKGESERREEEGGTGFHGAGFVSRREQRGALLGAN